MQSKLTMAQQTLVAEVVDSAVQKYCPYPPLQSCAWYALLGSYAANHLIGSTYYRLIGGSLKLFVAPDSGDGKGSYSFEMIAHDVPMLKQNSEAVLYLSPHEPVQLEFHAWFGVTECYNFNQYRHIEAVDLTSQHYQEWVRIAGLQWLRPPVPRALWADEQGLADMRIELIPYNGLDRVIFEILWQMHEFREAIAFLGRSL